MVSCPSDPLGGGYGVHFTVEPDGRALGDLKASTSEEGGREDKD